MKPILRLLWLIGYIPMFVLEIGIFVFRVFFFPFLGLIYFVITGSVENIPYDFLKLILRMDYEYKKLLEKINKT